MASLPLSHAKAHLFRALGHPVRVQILDSLSEGPKTVGQLVESLPIQPANLSQHLAVLRRSAVITSRREDGLVIYAVSSPDVPLLLLTGRRILEHAWSEQNSLLAELRETAETS